MSTFVPYPFACPTCGIVTEHMVPISVNASRSPKWRVAILDGAFLRFVCPSCGAPKPVEPRFTYVDFGRRQFVAVHPTADAGAWTTAERDALGLFHRNLGADAPPVAQSLAEGFAIRVVFGLDALREKLVAWEHGIDDVVLELLKLQLVCSGAPVPVRLLSVDDALRFTGDIDVPVTELEVVPIGSSLASDLSAGPYRDLARVLATS